VFFTDTLTGYGIEFTNNILKTVDGGKSWSVIYSRESINQIAGFRLYSLFFSDPKSGFVCKDKEVILQTMEV
jgi:photosystem II stability/assembly factor-like uncharacterized protein